MSTRDEDKHKDEAAAGYDQEAAQSESLLGRCYEICIEAQLDASWSEWFEGLDMQPFGEKWTKLCGQVADQAALLGILNKLCRLNLPLVSVNEVKGEERGPDAASKGGG